jgi:small basic protein
VDLVARESKKLITAKRQPLGMFSFVTAPAFFLGLFRGMENRKNNPVSDPWVAYRFAAIASVLGSVRAYSDALKGKPRPPPGISVVAGSVAGVILAGTTYYIGNKLGEEVPRNY